MVIIVTNITAVVAQNAVLMTISAYIIVSGKKYFWYIFRNAEFYIQTKYVLLNLYIYIYLKTYADFYK